MPEAIVEMLGLDITKPYRELYALDSKKVKYLVVIKDLVINLSEIPWKNLIMDVIIDDITVSYGMLLSRDWGDRHGAMLQLDMSYATICIPEERPIGYIDKLGCHMLSMI
jgi:hypothetical protein